MPVATDRFQLHWSLGVDSFGVLPIHAKGFVQLNQLARCQIAPGARRNCLKHQRSQSHAAQSHHSDADGLHHAPHNVIQPLVQDNLDHDTLARFPHQANLVRDNGAAVDFEAPAQDFELAFARPLVGDDVIFLGQAKPRVHHPVRDVTIVREQDEPLRIAIEPTDRVNTLRDIHEVHDGPAAAFVLDGGDEAGWFVEQDEARFLAAQGFAIDADMIRRRIDARSENGHNLAVDRHATGGDHRFRRPPRGNAATGEDALQAFAARRFAF
jgi:hypothetical protein